MRGGGARERQLLCTRLPAPKKKNSTQQSLQYLHNLAVHLVLGSTAHFLLLTLAFLLRLAHAALSLRQQHHGVDAPLLLLPGIGKEEIQRLGDWLAGIGKKFHVGLCASESNELGCKGT